MIIIAILLHILGNCLPKWLVSKVKHNNHILKLSGLVFDFFIAFLVLFLIHLLSPKAHYIDNKDAIYGLEFNQTMQQLGFKNEDKIISVNNQPVKDIRKINVDILMNSNSEIKIKRNGTFKELKITYTDVAKILQSEGTPIKDIFKPTPEEKNAQEIKQTQEKFSFGKVLKNYQNNIKEAYGFIIPKNDYKKVGGIGGVSKNFSFQISFLPFCCIVIGLLNLLPFPGFSVGNFIISLIESKRGKVFNFKLKNIVGLFSVSAVIIIIFYIHY
ncbi:hypothetical protein ASG31_02385 [Chryseobacterium sp. Leaf404]|uniref:M50 family metallopeptidase n=1 Tax=unclassified Chryseobacterium TaxID=2593645 RepID=UPI0006F7259E|nr:MULTISPECIES: M50 family metallopeptidase [unclassified Chryseobacterium]KQT22206.1 hypothetical protein ASG31_02385 [Chryseobacterium sp. Leaf404]